VSSSSLCFLPSRTPFCACDEQIRSESPLFARRVPPRPVTASAPALPRFDQGFLSLVLIIGFVFSAPLVIPVVAVVAGISAWRPEISPVPRLITLLVEQRVGPEASESMRAEGYPPPWRTAAALLAGILAIGTLVLVVGDKSAAWAFGLPAAGLAALASVGGVCVGCQLHARRAGRG
jgi:L-asparagine transporter-like permease